MPRVLFIADQFSDAPRTPGEGHPGGAELTDAAAIEACPWPIESVRAADLDPARLDDFDVHVIANFETASTSLIRKLVSHGRHVMFEHDLRVCQWNGNFPVAWEKFHRHAQHCICPCPRFSPLYQTAIGSIFLTRRQLSEYRRNPFFELGRHRVLGSSLMNRAFLSRADRVRARDPVPRDIDTAIVYSRHDIKGFRQARAYCERANVDPFVIRGMEPSEVLDTFECARRVVYLPIALEPAGRILVEARFLGAEVISNPNAGVAGEAWWRFDDGQALEVLRDAPARFWRFVDEWFKQSNVEAERVADPPSVSGLATLAAPVANATLCVVQSVTPSSLMFAGRRARAQRRAAASSTVSHANRLPAEPDGTPDDH